MRQSHFHGLQENAGRIRRKALPLRLAVPTVAKSSHSTGEQGEAGRADQPVLRSADVPMMS